MDCKAESFVYCIFLVSNMHYSHPGNHTKMRNALDNSGLFNTKNLLATENNMPTRKNHRLMLLNGGT